MGTRARVERSQWIQVLYLWDQMCILKEFGARRRGYRRQYKGNTIDIYMDTQSQCISWGAKICDHIYSKFIVKYKSGQIILI